MVTGSVNSSDVNINDGQTHGMKVSRRRGIYRQELLEETINHYSYLQEKEES